MDELQRLRQLIEQLNQLIADMEAQKTRTRHTQATGACFDDCLAVAIDLILSERRQSEYRQARINQLIAILQRGRESPYSYPIDQPAGLRIPIRRSDELKKP